MTAMEISRDMLINIQVKNMVPRSSWEEEETLWKRLAYEQSRSSRDSCQG